MEDLFQKGVELLSFLGKGNAISGTDQELKGQFLFKRGHHLTDGGLGIAQCVGGFVKLLAAGRSEGL